jgi:hypothetical protein
MYRHNININSQLNDIKLEELFKMRNVIVAGETHGDQQTHDLEAKLLPPLKISVSYENETIKATDRNVTPDPPAYRLLYYLEDFYEQLFTRMLNHDNPASRQKHYGLMDAIYNRYVREFSNYGPIAIEDSRHYNGEKLWTTYDSLDGFKKILFNTLALIENSPDDVGVYSNELIQYNARDLEKLFNYLKEKSDNSRDKPVMRKLRSTMMYQALKDDLADGVKRVYKVGSNHIEDICAKYGNPAWVIDEEQYKMMLSKLQG